MTELHIEPEADAELEEAAIRYEQNLRGLGMQFLAEMRQRIRDVLETPESFPRFDDMLDVRCAHAIGRFPHLVVYMVFNDTVHVLAFMHPRQRPGYWVDRVPRNR